MADTNALAALAAALEQFDVPTYDALPEIDLYMDQVIGYLNRLLCRVCRSEDGAPLTPSMINNYVKGGHVERPVQKKYSRDRIAMLYMLCCLKQNLTISEAAALLGGERGGIGLAHARDKQRHAQRQHELELLDGILGVVLDAARGLRLHDGVHFLAKYRNKTQCRGKGEGVAIRHVQYLDAGVGKVVELGHHEHEDEWQRHAQQAQHTVQRLRRTAAAGIHIPIQTHGGQMAVAFRLKLRIRHAIDHA